MLLTILAAYGLGMVLTTIFIFIGFRVGIIETVGYRDEIAEGIAWAVVAWPVAWIVFFFGVLKELVNRFIIPKKGK
jgi:hypothetical protein